MEKSEIWFGPPQAINNKEFKYKFVIYQFLNLVKELINFTYSSAEMEELEIINRPQVREKSEISLVRQNMYRNLKIPSIFIEFLITNKFVLDNVNERNKHTSLFLTVFEKLFQFMEVFCVRNQVNKKELYSFIHVFISYLAYIDVGQSQLIGEIFKDNVKALKQLDVALVQQIIHKIIRKPDLDPSRERGQASFDANHYDPKYLRILENLMFYKQDALPNNMKLILEQLLSTSKIQDYLYLRKNPGQKQKGDSAVAMTSTVPPQKRAYFGAYVFDLHLSKVPNGIPYVYHILILRLFNFFMDHLQSGLKPVKIALVKCLDINYLYWLLARTDYYQDKSLKCQLRTLLKIELLQLTSSVWVQNPTQVHLDYLRNSFFLEFIIKERKTFAKQFNIRERQEVQKSQTEIPLHKEPSDQLYQQIEHVTPSALISRKSKTARGRTRSTPKSKASTRPS